MIKTAVDRLIAVLRCRAENSRERADRNAVIFWPAAVF